MPAPFAPSSNVAPESNGGVVAVTGASGFVGRRVVPLLLHAGQRVRSLDRSQQSGTPGVTSVAGDLSQPESLAELVAGADALVHMAGVAHTRLTTQADVERARAANLQGSRALFQAAAAAGVRRVVFLSSAHVYAGQRGKHLSEDAATAPDGLYAEMKLGAEAAARALPQHGVSIAVLRPPLVYGAGARFNLWSLMRAVRGGYYVHPGGADAERSMVAVQNLAAAVVHMLRLQQSGTWNVADQQPVSLRAWVDALAAHLGARPPRTVPVGLLRVGARVGGAAARLGLPAPLTPESLAKLTESFSLNTSALAATGFQWSDGETDLREMALAYVSASR